MEGILLDERETIEHFWNNIHLFFGNLKSCRDFSELTEFPSADLICVILDMESSPLQKSMLRYCVDHHDLPTLLIRCFKFISQKDNKEIAEEREVEKELPLIGDDEESKMQDSTDIITPDKSRLNDYLKSLMISIVDMTDLSQDLCEQFGRQGCLEHLLDILRFSAISDIDRQLALTCVYNCCRRVSENRAICRKAIDMFEDLTKSTDLEVQADAFLTLSYIVDKTETNKISLNQSCIEFLLDVLTEALRSPTRRCRGYSVLEIVQGINQLAINDSNKCLILRLGGLDLLERTLQDGACSEEEKRYAARGVWQLAFVEDNKVEIRRREKLLESLKILKDTSSDDSLQDACSGALFVINDIDKRFRDDSSHSGAGVSSSGSKEGGSHIMISYQHSNQADVLKVKVYLEKHGYNVWMDVDKMKGDILETMARAVQRSVVVLVCMSQKFKESQHCRTEATYAYTLKKDIIPLMLQEGYTPDDWLGALLGMKLYYPLYSKELMDGYLPQLMGVLGERGKLDSSIIPASTPQEGDSGLAIRSSSETTDEPDSGNLRDLKSSDSLTTVQHRQVGQHFPCQQALLQATSVESWKKDRVQDWLESIGLDEARNSNLQKLDGLRISQICSLMNRAPEYCMQALERELGLSFWDVLSFTSALERLSIHNR